MTYAFTFDASACTGCKACQVACKDKHQLPVGVLWRRVYEVAGGGWQAHGAAWQTDVFAYNLSIACNHCMHPKCAGVCPADAYVTRLDGIVYIDASKCIGCGYCLWACPYAAPRYDPHAGIMTKCDFCFDDLDSGLPPACVAACPLRVLDFITVDETPLAHADQLPLWQVPGTQHPFPLPLFSRTEPHLALHEHPAMRSELEPALANREETDPPPSKSEIPLLAFTLLGQASAGLALFLLIGGGRKAALPAILIGLLLLGLGMLGSFLHLGKPLRAWRAVFHLRKSWLSREILRSILFGLAWLLCAFFYSLPNTAAWILNASLLLASLSGLSLVDSMAQVYRLRAVPAWNSPRTSLAFLTSTVLFGGSLTLCLASLTGFRWASASLFTWVLAGLASLGALLLAVSDHGIRKNQKNLRIALQAIVLALFALAGLIHTAGSPWLPVFILVIVSLEQALARWQFYSLRSPQM
jgi:anaerobic dimethyl sulfoxide reductase subunit B